MVLTYVNRNQITLPDLGGGRETHSKMVNGRLNDGTKARTRITIVQDKGIKIDGIETYFRKGTLLHDSLCPISHRLARFPFHTRNNHINIGTPPHSYILDHPLFPDNAIYSRGKRKGVEVSKPPVLQFPSPLSLFLSSKRTIQAPPLFLHSFLDCICSLLDIPFY